jgi:hypothetical protein
MVVAVDEEMLDMQSKRLLKALLSDPELSQAQLSMEAPEGGPQQPEQGEWSLVARYPSPTGDPDRDVVLWLAWDRAVSVSFADWHMHEWLASPAEGELEYLLRLVRGLIAGTIVLVLESGPDDDSYPAALWPIDRSDTEEVLDLLTDPSYTGPLLTISWDQQHDGVLTLGTPLQ